MKWLIYNCLIIICLCFVEIIFNFLNGCCLICIEIVNCDKIVIICYIVKLMKSIQIDWFIDFHTINNNFVFNNPLSIMLITILFYSYNYIKFLYLYTMIF